MISDVYIGADNLDASATQKFIKIVNVQQTHKKPI